MSASLRRVRRSQVVAAAFSAALLVACASSRTRPGVARASASRALAGAWRLDRAQSAGLPPDSGSPPVMTFHVTPDSLVQELRATRPDGSPEYRRLSYRFDGAVVTDTVVNGTNGVSRIAGSAHWQQDTLVLVREAQYPRGVIVMTDRLTVSPDGELLTIAQTAGLPAGTRAMRLVLRRMHR